ncbi:hypothetical protein [Domibacillus epiphyticus]|uniref:Uncharacterized protein n=1 Tax=Domibacillus epiphyticus TaxID=1714355 RepID=A0A1V2ACK6_9BACI|nr:hypothetical protein [Domibacillus epiphyticus]OMP68697.1 hypothetical protein BTO28_01220 [Domibacillus epiphyticus]
MIEISIDEKRVEELYKKAVEEKLEKIEHDRLLMSSKDLQKYLGLSYPTLSELFFHDPDFPIIRVGTRMLFYKPEIDVFIDGWVDEVRNNYNGQAKNMKISVNKVSKARKERSIS